ASRRRHTSSTRDWSPDVCSSDLSGSYSFAAGKAAVVHYGRAARGLSLGAIARGKAVAATGCIAEPASNGSIETAGGVATAPSDRSEERRVGKGGSCAGSSGADVR